MRLGFIFLFLALALIYLAINASQLILIVLLANCALTQLILSGSYFLNSPRIFCKTRDGGIPIAIRILLWPYFLPNGLVLKFHRFISKEDAFNEIRAGLFIGCRLSERDVKSLAAKGIISVLDATAEFEELSSLRANRTYCCIPVLDHAPPRAEQLREGVDFIKDNLSRGPVYVHCALGHGRSATFVAAYLLVSGIATSAADAIASMQSKRPAVNLNAKQLSALISWYELRPTPG